MSCPDETRGITRELGLITVSHENCVMPRYRDESVATKWDQLKQYEEEVSGGERSGAGLDLRQYERSNSLRVVRTFQQIKESSSKTYSSIKNQVTELYRKTVSKSPGPGPRVLSGASVSQSPHGDLDPHTGPLHSLGIIGAKIRNSRSLQNLEVSTLDNIRHIVDTTTSAAGNLKHKYGSELQNRAKYDKFKDSEDGDSEDERDM